MRLVNILFDSGAGRIARPQIGGRKIRAFASDRGDCKRGAEQSGRYRNGRARTGKLRAADGDQSEGGRRAAVAREGARMELVCKCLYLMIITYKTWRGSQKEFGGAAWQCGTCRDRALLCVARCSHPRKKDVCSCPGFGAASS